MSQPLGSIHTIQRERGGRREHSKGGSRPCYHPYYTEGERGRGNTVREAQGLVTTHTIQRERGGGGNTVREAQGLVTTMAASILYRGREGGRREHSMGGSKPCYDPYYTEGERGQGEHSN
jgi:hypothetical protein